MTTLNTMAGGRGNVESGLQTGLDIVATMAWWDWTAPGSENNPDTTTTMGDQSGVVLVVSLVLTLGLIGAATFAYLRYGSLSED